MLAQQGSRGEARTMLAEIIYWFDGFDTADLKEAKALLEELPNNAKNSTPNNSENDIRRPFRHEFLVDDNIRYRLLK
jgi:hypothetical protein